jgi:hypothetical protein
MRNVHFHAINPHKNLVVSMIELIRHKEFSTKVFSKKQNFWELNKVYKSIKKIRSLLYSQNILKQNKKTCVLTYFTSTGFFTFSFVNAISSTSCM